MVETDYEPGPTLAAASAVVQAGWDASVSIRERLLRAVPGPIDVVWVGGGHPNRLGVLLRDHVDTAVVVDTNRELLERLPPLGRHDRRVLAAAEAVPVDDGWADAVELQGCLDHLVDPTAGVREAVRVTRPGGLVVISLSNDGAWYRRLGRRWAPEDPHPHHFTSEQVAGLLRGAGLVEVEVRTVMHLRLPAILERRATPHVVEATLRRLLPRGGGITVAWGRRPAAG